MCNPCHFLYYFLNHLPILDDNKWWLDWLEITDAVQTHQRSNQARLFSDLVEDDFGDVNYDLATCNGLSEEHGCTNVSQINN